tara:strand:- start:641 stop:1258 length:618 start_codon:yes stop_codon:yes gene_type:complete
MKKGIIAKKIGMTQLLDENGIVSPVTVLQPCECSVLDVKNIDKDGYDSILIGYGDIKESKVNKPKSGLFKKLNVKPKKHIKELRFENHDEIKGLKELTVDQFTEGEHIACTSKSTGKGFQGTIKVHGFARGPMTHGSKNHRLPGSIGAGTDPARVFKGTKMGKKLGNKQRTIKGLKLVKIDKEKNIMFVKGSIPGKRKNLVLLHS